MAHILSVVATPWATGVFLLVVTVAGLTKHEMVPTTNPGKSDLLAPRCDLRFSFPGQLAVHKLAPFVLWQRVRDELNLFASNLLLS